MTNVPTDGIAWGDLMNAAGGTFEPVPPGPYDVKVAQCEFSPTSNGKARWKTRMEILNGPHAGRLLFFDMTISPENQFALRFFFTHMAALGLSQEFFNARPNPDQVTNAMLGRMARATVVHDTYQGQIRDKIKNLEPLPGGVPGPTGPVVAPAPVPGAVTSPQVAPAPTVAAAAPVVQPQAAPVAQPQVAPAPVAQPAPAAAPAAQPQIEFPAQPGIDPQPQAPVAAPAAQPAPVAEPVAPVAAAAPEPPAGPAPAPIPTAPAEAPQAAAVAPPPIPQNF